jgi:hypothetical protein
MAIYQERQHREVMFASEVRTAIAQIGGLVNTLAHLHDPQSRGEHSFGDLKLRMLSKLEAMKEQGIRVVGGVVDLGREDSDQLLRVARVAQESIGGLDLKIIGHVSSGIVNPIQARIFLRRIRGVDAISGNPSADSSGRARHVAMVLDTARTQDLPVFMRIARGDEGLADLQAAASEVVARGMEGKVTLWGDDIMRNRKTHPVIADIQAGVIVRPRELVLGEMPQFRVATGTNGAMPAWNLDQEMRQFVKAHIEDDKSNLTELLRIGTTNGREALKAPFTTRDNVK